MDFIKQPDGDLRLGDWLNLNFRDESWEKFSAAVAFVKASGVRHIATNLESFIRSGKSVKFVVGIDHRGTSSEGLRIPLDCVQAAGEIWISHNQNPSTFHPKVYLFENEFKAAISVGSGNMTEGGLYTNYEAIITMSLRMEEESERRVYEGISESIREWSNSEDGLSRRLDEEFLAELIQRNLVPTEVRTREADEDTGAVGEETEEVQGEAEPDLFPRLPVKRAPATPERHRTTITRRGRRVIIPTAPLAEENQNFLMTLQQTDVGVGQTTAGTSRRSPEIFIPLAARNANREFWDWPGSFIEDAARRGKFDRMGVRMRLGGDIIDVNMMTWPVKHDFRLRSEALRRAGNVGDILRMEKVEGQDYSYYVEIIPQNTTQHRHYLALCQNQTRNSQKTWGYF